jgi:hypothetical protein
MSRQTDSGEVHEAIMLWLASIGTARGWLVATKSAPNGTGTNA